MPLGVDGLITQKIDVELSEIMFKDTQSVPFYGCFFLEVSYYGRVALTLCRCFNA